jgi:peptidoglycan/xylan/chitin deacetylase (PgdA/CDA1 family)
MNDLLILCYHAVSPSWPAALSVTPDALESQMTKLARAGYRGVRFSDALGLGEQLEGRVVSVTFDDNYRSVLEFAKPILDRHGYPGTVFVPTDWPGESRPMLWQGIDHWLGTPHEHELSALSWEELRKLADAGWEIGSHTCSHPYLPDLDEAALSHELRDSRARIEAELGQPCTSLAYPYGGVDARVVDATHRAGYRWAGTIPRTLPSPHPLTWPRAAIYHDDDMRRFGAKVSPSLRRLRASRLGVSMDRARLRVSEWKQDGTTASP